MKLSTLINENLVFLNSTFNSYHEVVNFLAERIAKNAGLPVNEIKAAFEKRENIGTTFIGHLCALPHGYIDAHGTIVVAFMRMGTPLITHFDNRPVTIKYVFAILTAKEKAQLYLNLLASIANLVKHYSYILDQAESGKDFAKLLDEKEIYISESITAKDLISCPAAVPLSATVSQAIDRMKQYGITLLPVVDNDGLLKGVVDLADLFMAILPQETKEALDHTHAYNPDMAAAYWEPIRHFWDNEEKRVVGDVMRTADTLTVVASAGYAETIFRITKFHHHYLIVVDESGKALGVIDTNLIIRNMIRA